MCVRGVACPGHLKQTGLVRKAKKKNGLRPRPQRCPSAMPPSAARVRSGNFAHARCAGGLAQGCAGSRTWPGVGRWVGAAWVGAAAHTARKMRRCPSAFLRKAKAKVSEVELRKVLRLLPLRAPVTQSPSAGGAPLSQTAVPPGLWGGLRQWGRRTSRTSSRAAAHGTGTAAGPGANRPRGERRANSPAFPA